MKKVVLHTDSARAYESFLDGIAKIRVVHQVKRDSQGVLHKPHFTKVEHIRISDDTVISVVAGTQYVDGFWKHLRQEVLSHKGSQEALNRKVRIAQWRYWTMYSDRWQALASTF